MAILHGAVRLLCLAALCAPLLCCVGPEAPDAALCQDLIGRLCRAPLCGGVEATLAVSAEACEATLLERTGCAAEEFTFVEPNRARILECRLPLVRSGLDQTQHPDCDDVSESLERCDDLVRFLGGAP